MTGAMRIKKHSTSAYILVVAAIWLLQIVPNARAQTTGAAPQDEETEINKKLSNAISTIWALQLQENTYFIHPGLEDQSSRNSVNLQFQPVLPCR